MRFLIVFIDILAVCMGLVITHWMATLYGPHPEGIDAVPVVNLLLPNPHMPSGLMLLTSWLGMLYLSGGYNPYRMNTSARTESELKKISVRDQFFFNKKEVFKWVYHL